MDAPPDDVLNWWVHLPQVQLAQEQLLPHLHPSFSVAVTSSCWRSTEGAQLRVSTIYVD
jgi:hypothetical protein